MPDLPSSARRELAVVHDYDDLRTALRARAEQLDISRLEIDRVSGVANGYSAAVLSDMARKRIGPVNLGPMLGALGLALVLVEDPDMMARYTARAEKRVPNMSTKRLSRNAINRAKLVIFSDLGRKGAAVMLATKTKIERVAWAKAAAAKRWRNYQAKKQAAHAG